MSEMAFYKRRKIKVEPSISPGSEFAHAMSFLEYNCKLEQDITYKIAVIDYFMNVIKMDIQSDLLSTVFYLNKAIEIEDILPSHYYDEGGIEHEVEYSKRADECIDLSKDAVFVIPWDSSRIITALWSIIKDGYQYEEGNIWAAYYTEIDFTFVFSGRHHTAAAIVNKEGFIKAYCYDLKPLFPHLCTDGKEWINAHTKQSISKLCDFRFGLLYEAAKKRNELLNGKSIEIQHLDDLTERATFLRSLGNDIDAAAYYRLIDERNYYKYRHDLEKAIVSPNEKETVTRIKPYNK